MRLASILTFALLAPAIAQEPTWHTNFEEAKTLAKNENKPILANFTGSDWCGWCIKLKDEVFSTPEFAEWAGKNVVLLELDFPRKTKLADDLAAQNKDLAKQFGVQGYPTVLVLDAEGKQVGSLRYAKGGPANWIKLAEEQIQNGAKQGAGKDAGSADKGDWTTNYEAALAKAKKEKKVILADFTGSDWCHWCVKLKEEVFSKPEFLEWAKDNVVLLELDFPRSTKLDAKLQEQNDKLAKEFGIKAYPTIVFIDAKGKDVGRSGYVKGGPEAWIAAAEKAAGIKSKKKPKAKGE